MFGRTVSTNQLFQARTRAEHDVPELTVSPATGAKKHIQELVFQVDESAKSLGRWSP